MNMYAILLTHSCTAINRKWRQENYQIIQHNLTAFKPDTLLTLQLQMRNSPNARIEFESCENQFDLFPWSVYCVYCGQ